MHTGKHPTDLPHGEILESEGDNYLTAHPPYTIRFRMIGTDLLYSPGAIQVS